ncbi:ABC transporter ATP-binding protein [Solimonas terrae]|uniref:ABC transporter ATP-binding protein n=1 Tax=Solimonas terrae TaxID=1396819 RepID=A0A6M2BWX5_9GAMM|nr:ABC transporter ATP-binding protein [Solimonas terrae]NGY06691.1 ABC transporter ATP-binding protein [Solimonas terrae]
MIGYTPTTTDAPRPESGAAGIRVFRYTKRALELVWRTSPWLLILLVLLTVVAGVLPAAIAYVGARIVDAVVAAIAIAQHAGHAGGYMLYRPLLAWVALEGLLVAAASGTSRMTSLCQSLLRIQLGQRVNVMILEKALTLELTHFEDSEFYDNLVRARREASVRPLALIMKTANLAQNAISLISYGALLIQFSPWAVTILLLAGVPSFAAEAKFSGQAFQLFRWRSPATRMQTYLETVIAREDHAKEVKLFGLGPLLLGRYRGIFDKLYGEERSLAIRRDAWGFGLGLLGVMAYYGAYAWVAIATVLARITLGQMTMYLALFRNGQTAVTSSLSAISGMYEDNLYLSTLYEYLETPVAPPRGTLPAGPQPQDGIRFERVSFTYPGADAPALQDIDLHIRPGQSLALVGENGAGKTTLIKLLTRLYQPTSGRVLLDGLDLQEWDETALRARIGVIFQDFARYQLIVGENIGAGDVRGFDAPARWQEAAEKGMAAQFVEALPQGYNTQLGKWFRDGRELSGGQWQKIALSRAFMRSEADILVLDEPTAAMDAGAEAEIFSHFRALMHNRIAIVISHRFSTVRMADQIIVVDQGHIVERGNHAELMAVGGIYAKLFSLQARGYQ